MSEDLNLGGLIRTPVFSGNRVLNLEYEEIVLNLLYKLIKEIDEKLNGIIPKVNKLKGVIRQTVKRSSVLKKS